MLRELRKDKRRGLLSAVLLTASPRTYCVVQYREPKENPYGYAHAPDAFRRVAWAAINRKERKGVSAYVAVGDLCRAAAGWLFVVAHAVPRAPSGTEKACRGVEAGLFRGWTGL